MAEVTSLIEMGYNNRCCFFAVQTVEGSSVGSHCRGADLIPPIHRTSSHGLLLDPVAAIAWNEVHLQLNLFAVEIPHFTTYMCINGSIESVGGTEHIYTIEHTPWVRERVVVRRGLFLPYVIVYPVATFVAISAKLLSTIGREGTVPNLVLVNLKAIAEGIAAEADTILILAGVGVLHQECVVVTIATRIVGILCLCSIRVPRLIAKVGCPALEHDALVFVVLQIVDGTATCKALCVAPFAFWPALPVDVHYQISAIFCAIGHPKFFTCSTVNVIGLEEYPTA